jgi:hypothetical protein
MRLRRRSILLAAILALAAGLPGQSAPSDEQALLSLHATILRAHRENDLPAWMAAEADRFVLVNRGEITYPTKAERESVMAPYLKKTKFREYRDLVPPIVRVSKDGSLGWLIAQVAAAGVQTDASGKEKPIAFTAAWIELYEKQGGRWVGVGNVSNFKE